MNSKTHRAIRKSRSLHLIDIENLCGDPFPTLKQVAKAREKYFELIAPGVSDLFYVTVSSHHNLQAIVFGWPGARIACREGRDGADILLAEEMLESRTSGSFQQIFLGSGDGGLAPFAQHLVNRGVDLVVVSMSRCLSQALRSIGAPVKTLELRYELVA